MDLYRHHVDFGLASKSPIAVHLDTRRALQKKIEEKREYWPAFFAQELERIDILDIHICSGLGRDTLAFLDVISDTQAPCLQRLDLYFDEDVTDNAGLRRLFGGNAPHLRNLHISAAQPFDLSHFRTVKHAQLRISHHNIMGIFDMVGGLPELRKLDLKGAQRWMGQFLPDDPAQPVHLRECTSLNILDVYPTVMQLLLAGLILPKLEHLVVKERAFFENNLIVTSFPSALRMLSHPAEPREWLHLRFHPHQLLIRTRGWCYEMDWHQVSLRDPSRLVHFLERRILREFASVVNLQPGQVLVENYIVAPKRDYNTPAYLIQEDLHSILAFMTKRMCQIWSSVALLSLLGDGTPMIRVLCNPQEVLIPNLQRIDMLHVGNDIRTTCDQKYKTKLLKLRKVVFEDRSMQKYLAMGTKLL